MKTLTVFTPSYNRAYCLGNSYEALKRQSCKDFVWMIIDDGSSDNTQELVESWQKQDNGFDIIYIKKKNEGLHTGYNTAIEHSQTELMVCIDSDDYMPDDAVELITELWKKPHGDNIAGIMGMDFHPDGTPLAPPLTEEKTYNYLSMFSKHNKVPYGDRKFVVRTDIYRTVAPMKVFEGEKNFNPNYMLVQIAFKYDFLVLNRNLCFVEESDVSMTKAMLWQYYNSPNSFAEIRRLHLTIPDISFKYKFRECVHMASSYFIAKRKGLIKESPEKLLTILAVPAGFVLSKYIIRKNKKK